jgi:hypothetical protein
MRKSLAQKTGIALEAAGQAIADLATGASAATVRPLPFELTTLELCRRIADAVIAAYETESLGPFYRDDRPDHQHPPTQAVIAMLEQTGSWLCKLETDPAGATVQTRYGPAGLDRFELCDRR